MFEAKLYLIYIFLNVHYLNIDQRLSYQHNEIYKDTTNVTYLNCLFYNWWVHLTIIQPDET